MRIRKSGLEGYFSRLDCGVSAYLETCSECNRYIFTRWIRHPGKQYRNAVQELKDNDVCIGGDGIGNNDKRFCDKCMDRNYEEEYMVGIHES